MFVAFQTYLKNDAEIQRAREHYMQTGGDLSADSVSATHSRSRKRLSYDPTTVGDARGDVFPFTYLF